MFKYKIIFLIFLFILISSIILNGCNNIENNDEIGNYKLGSEQNRFNVADEEIYSSIPNLKYFINFLNMVDYIDKKYNKNIEGLTNKFNNDKNLEVKIEYAQKLIDEYNEYIADFVYFVNREIKIYEVSFLDDACYYKTKTLIEITSYFIYFTNIEKVEKLREANDNAIVAYNNYKEEIRELKEHFNNKAEELGFQQPFEWN